MFVILQKYDFSSKSQPATTTLGCNFWCLWYCKSTIFQANHNRVLQVLYLSSDVCDTAKVRFFKQITTDNAAVCVVEWMFVILQKYDFSSKSQPWPTIFARPFGCLWYCKSTIFQANHNGRWPSVWRRKDVCDTAKVRFFKQITTRLYGCTFFVAMFVILQKYDFSSKSQLVKSLVSSETRCLWYCKSTIFQANHNLISLGHNLLAMFVILQKYDFSSKSQPMSFFVWMILWCLWYCKSTIFQANHNRPYVCETN